MKAAIDLLIRSASREGTDKYTPSVVILKAAEKMDKKAALVFMDRVNEDEETRDENGKIIFPLMRIRALLESLPDKE